MYTLWANTSQHIMHVLVCMSTQTHAYNTSVYALYICDVGFCKFWHVQYKYYKNKTTTQKTKQSKIK